MLRDLLLKHRLRRDDLCILSVFLLIPARMLESCKVVFHYRGGKSRFEEWCTDMTERGSIINPCLAWASTSAW